MELIIVESPHKAKTIEKFLKGDYKVDASKGHVRDLPVNRMGIRIANNFEPFYEISAEKKADITAKNIENYRDEDGMGVSFDCVTEQWRDRINLGFPGKFNVYGGMTALATH